MSANFYVGYAYGDGQLVGAGRVDFRSGIRLNYKILDVRLCHETVLSRSECGDIIPVVYVGD